jgi:hypothetical protein
MKTIVAFQSVSSLRSIGLSVSGAVAPSASALRPNSSAGIIDEVKVQPPAVKVNSVVGDKSVISAGWDELVLLSVVVLRVCRLRCGEPLRLDQGM